MLRSIRNAFEMLGDQVWFFRFFVVICVICVYRTLLNFVLRSNHCANPFCSKCLSSSSVRGRAINKIKDDSDGDNSLKSIIHSNLIQHDRLCLKSDEKPTVYFHRGLSSNVVHLADQQILIDHYDDLRQEIVKFFQENDNIQWTNFYLCKNGEENKVNCEKLPKLFEVLHLLPNIICVNNQHCMFGNCFLTRLTSDNSNNNNEEEKSRSGFTNCSIRIHLGLMCDDQSSAYVLINKRKRLPIKNKHTILYNDAVEHSIENPTNTQQVFLTADFWHPDLSPDMRKELASVFRTDLS